MLVSGRPLFRLFRITNTPAVSTLPFTPSKLLDTQVLAVEMPKRKAEEEEEEVESTGQNQVVFSGTSKKPKKKEKPEELYNDSEFYTENGLRKVYPYHFTYSAFCKRRWIGYKLQELFEKEFRAFRPDVFRSKLQRGLIKVNNKCVDEDHVLKDNQILTNYAHRHELPVLACRIPIIHISDDMLVIDKPPSIPIHPCGRYRHNTITTILQKEHNLKNLHGIHRLDRLTSGVLMFARTLEKSREIDEQIRSRIVEKEYVCRVVGNFPDEEITCNEPIDVLSHKIGISFVTASGKECTTVFKKINFNGRTSAVSCKPKTGRMHQIRVHLQYLGYPIVNDSFYNSTIFGPEKGKLGDFGGKTNEQILDELHQAHCFDKWISEGEKEITEEEIRQNEIALKAVSYYFENEESKQLRERYNFDRNKLILDSDCHECALTLYDPQPKDLFLYLHAFRYKGPDWEYQTKMPIWVNENWQD